MSQAGSRRRLGWLLAVLGLGLVGTGAGLWLVRARRTGAPSAPGAAQRPTRERAGLAPWAGDPDAPRGAIEGVVRTPDGKPYQGALVAAVPAAPDRERVKPAGITRSSDGGRFRIENLRPGPYGATATAPGFAPAFKGELTLLAGETLRGIELVLEKQGVVIHGHVQDSGGGPIAGAEVRAARHSKDEGDVFQVAADAQGAYQITLARGEYTLTADAEGYAPEDRLVSAKTDQTIDFKLNPAATLRGRVVVRGRGEPVPGASVRLFGEGSWWNDKHTQSNAQGIFEFKDLDPGAYQLAAQKGALVGHLSRKVEVTLGGFLGDVTIEVDRGRTLSGHVRAKGGAPVAAAKLRLGEGPWGGFGGGRVRATSGPDGAYQIEGVLPGKYALHAQAKGFAPARKDDLLVADQDLDHVDLELFEGAQVSGKVVSKDGQPVAGAAVQAFVTTGGGMWGARSWAADRSGLDGSFTLKDLGAGQLHVEAEHPDQGHAALDPMPLGAGEKKQVTLTIQDAASISGTVKWDDGTPAAGVSVSGFSRRSMNTQTKTAADGSYKLSPLGKGTVMVSASRKDSGFFAIGRGSGSEPKVINLGANEHKTGVDLVLPRGGHRITGIVLAPDGKPVENAGVGANQENESGVSVRFRALGMMGGDTKVFTQADGSFAIDDLAVGKYTVWATHAGFPDAELEHVPADATGVRVQFKQEAVVAGVVTGGGSRPVADYVLTVLPTQQSDKARVVAFMGGSNQQRVHDPSGAFEIRGLQAGTYDLVVTTGDGHAGKLGGVTLAAGEQKRGLRIQVAQGVTLKGRVVEWGSGRPIADANVIAGVGGQPVVASTDAQGAYHLEGLPPGRVQLVASHGMPLIDGSKVLMDMREVNIAEGKDSWDAGTIKLVQGDIAVLMQALGYTGMNAINRDGRAYVDRVVPNSAAAKAGLKPGDALLTVDGRDVSDLGPTAIGMWTLGQPGTQVVIGYTPAGGAGVRQVTLTREPRPRGGGM